MGSKLGDLFGGGSLPKPAPLPAPVEEIDVMGQKSYAKKRLQGKSGRASTILASKLGMNQAGRETLG